MDYKSRALQGIIDDLHGLIYDDAEKRRKGVAMVEIGTPSALPEHEAKESPEMQALEEMHGEQHIELPEDDEEKMRVGRFRR